MAILGMPAGVLRALCVGRSCDTSAEASASPPFCSLHPDVRNRIANGFRDGRSPELLGVTGSVPVRAGGGPFAPLWPAEDNGAAAAAIAFWGTGVEHGTKVPAGTTFDAIAPTLAEIVALERPHPEVRSGAPIPGVSSGEGAPRLVLLAVVEPPPGAEMAGPWLERVLSEGAATREAEPGSLPLDPAATLTTIGTGGLPRQHGITGARIRNDDGDLVRAWGSGAPPSVISSLADDLDNELGGAPRVGMVATDTTERGLVGGGWYVDADEDDLVTARTPRRAARAAIEMVRSGYGSDDVVDILGVVMRGNATEIDAALAEVHAAASSAANDSVTVALVAIERGSPRTGSPLSWRRVASSVDESVGAQVVEGAAAGGFFTDQAALAQEEIPEEEIVNAIKSLTIDGRRIFADVFPAISVSFERYC
jgi:hypothetical protein